MSRSFWQIFWDAFTFTRSASSGDKTEEWDLLTEDSRTAIDGPWWVTENDLIGGWCVRTIGEPPSSGRGVTIADFIREEDARLCATARNLTMRTEAIAGIRAAETPDIAIDDDGTLYLDPRSSRQ